MKFVPGRSNDQIKTHAQKYLKKVQEPDFQNTEIKELILKAKSEKSQLFEIKKVPRVVKDVPLEQSANEANDCKIEMLTELQLHS